MGGTLEHSFLSIHKLNYSYHSMQGETPALKDISFTVKQGEFIAIVGPSGCGKSTLLSLIAGLLEADHGSITFSNLSHTDSPKIGYMLQQDHLFEWRTIYKNIILGLELTKKYNQETKDKVEKYMKDYGLWSFRDKKPSELSGGMKQRAALIRTLVTEPDLLLLDESFSALDYQTRLSVSGDIANIIRSQNKTAIIVTHDISEAISLADRVLILSRRPSTILAQIPIQLTLPDESVLASRNAPEFNYYFNQIWKELQNHDETADL